VPFFLHTLIWFFLQVPASPGPYVASPPGSIQSPMSPYVHTPSPAMAPASPYIPPQSPHMGPSTPQGGQGTSHLPPGTPGAPSPAGVGVGVNVGSQQVGALEQILQSGLGSMSPGTDSQMPVILTNNTGTNA